MNALNSPFAGTGVYRIADAARLAEVPVPKARAWVRGYARRLESEAQTRAAPRLPSRLPQRGKEPIVSFLDLIEMRFVRHFRLAGVRWSRITKALPILRDVFRQSSAGDVAFESDGVHLFADAFAQNGDRQAVELVSGNYVMADVLRRSFKVELRLDAGCIIRSWSPRPQFPNVVVNPHVQFGQPVVAPGIPTTVLADEFAIRKGDAEKVARRFNISVEAVLDAVGFEQSLKAAA